MQAVEKQQIGNELCEFAWNVGGALGFIRRMLKDHDGEALTELAAYGISKTELEHAIEPLERIGQKFYNVPQPI